MVGGRWHWRPGSLVLFLLLTISSRLFLRHLEVHHPEGTLPTTQPLFLEQTVPWICPFINKINPNEKPGEVQNTVVLLSFEIFIQASFPPHVRQSFFDLVRTVDRKSTESLRSISCDRSLTNEPLSCPTTAETLHVLIGRGPESFSALTRVMV